jgi:hypothetical protein
VTQPGITTTFSRNHTTGDVKVTEAERLWRCNGNAYPPTAESCTSLVDTGVTLKVVIELIRGNHQVLIHDTYVSSDDGAHTVAAQYQVQVARARDGAPGYIYPTHPGSFKHAAFDKVVTGFGTGAATVLARSDVYASSTDHEADTQALTWSRPPAEIRFSHNNTAVMSLPYRFRATAQHAATIGFAVSEAPLTATAKTLAAKAANAL